MAKTKISEFDIDPANNTDINSINIAEGCAPSGINNAIRQLMSDLKEFQTGAGGDSITAVGVYSDTIGEKTSAAGVTVDGVLIKDNAVTASGGFSGALNGAVGGTTPAAGAFTTLSASGAFSANGGATLGDASGDALTINSSAVSIPNGLNFDSNTLVIDATNNYVGIGVASPSSKLQVGSSANESVNATVSYGSSATGSAQRARLWLTNQAITAGFGLEMQGDNNALLFNYLTGGTPTERMRITSAGNVGIGTSSPSYKLDVAGLVSSQDAYLITANSSGTPSAGAFMYRPASNTLAFGTASTERMRIDSSGNVGIGTSSPAQKLDVSGSGITRIAVRDSSSTGVGLFKANGADVYLDNSSATGNLIFQNTNGTERMRIDSSGNVGIGTSSPSSALQVSRSGAVSVTVSSTGGGGNWEFGADASGNGYIYSGQSKYLALSTSGSERMRIDSSGNLLVGTTSAYGHLSVYGITGSDGTCISLREWGSGAGSAMSLTARSTLNADAIYFNTSSTNVGKIAITSTATSYVTSSDYRLKENIAPMTGALATVAQLKPVTYTWKADGSDGQGFIAHELQAVVPDCVTGEKDAVDADGNPVYQGIDTSFLVATLTKAIQELNDKVTALEAQLNK